MRRFAPFVVVILALSSWLGVGAAQLSAAAPPQLRLHRATFDARGVGRIAPTAALATAPGSYAIIQLRGSIAPADRAALERTGVKLLEYLPDYAYLVRGDATQLDAAAHLPQVYARTPFTLADKLAPPLLRALARGDIMPVPLRIVAWPGAEQTMQRDLRTRYTAGAATAAADLLQLASLESVRWIEPISRPRLLNDVARTIMHVDTAAWQGQGLFGANQTVAVADSGLDTGVMATISPDFAGRIIATHVLSAGGELGDQHGHGTHVAGSVAGAGVQSGANPAQHQYAGSFAGVAPEAHLVIQAFEALPDGSTVGIPSDYYTIFQQAYADGARIHTNSWGDYTGPITDTETSFGGYPFGAQRTDQFIWDHPDMAVFFAAGNSGADGTPDVLGLFCTNGDGVVDPDSLLSPGTSKNAVTVGAAETQRATGGFSQYPWLLVSFCFAADPVATDLVSNNPNGMAAFSSRGPTDDGRAKPDIVAPGTDIISNRSHYPGAGTLWAAYNEHYSYSGGTSMATPLAAGAGTLVRQWLGAHGIANPSAAVVKATLLNTTHDMAPGQYATGATQEIPFTRPNSVAGWGRVDLDFMNAPPSYALWVDDHTSGIATDESVSYTDTKARPLEVRDSTEPLRIMLAWTDPPASLSAARQLVNDLDLRVIGPGGTIYYGNNVASGDRINNVEGIVIDNPPVGQYSVEVRGFNVPIAAQPYALAVAGPIGSGGRMMLTKTANPATYAQAGGLITYTLQARAQGGPLSGIVLSDTLPANTTFVSASGTYTRSGPSNSLITWPIGGLAAGQIVTRTLTVRVQPTTPSGTTISNTGYSVSAAGIPPASYPPVTVTLQEPPPPKRIWLPLIAR